MLFLGSTKEKRSLLGGAERGILLNCKLRESVLSSWQKNGLIFFLHNFFEAGCVRYPEGLYSSFCDSVSVISGNS